MNDDWFILALLAFVSGSVCIIQIILKIKQLSKFSQKVEGVCIDIKTTLGEDYKEMYAPVYSYQYNGKDYIASTAVFSSGREPILNSKKKIRINPYAPQEFYQPNYIFDFFWIGLSAGFMIVGIVGVLLAVL